MALTAAQKKALDSANALKAKLEAQLAAAEKAQAVAAAEQAAAKKAAQDEELAAKKAAREADLAAKAAARRADAAPAGSSTSGAGAATGTGSPSGLAAKGSKIFQMLGGVLYFDGEPFTGTEGGKTYNNGVPGALPVTAATLTNSLSGGSATPGPTLAKDVFKQTLAIYFGQAEASKPWMDELYNLSAPLYKSGATMDEALNMALMQGRTNPKLADFTNRFKGVFALQDAKVGGKAVNVPTIAEYYNAEAGMGSVLRQAGLGDIATQDYLGDVIGRGLSVTDVGNYINNIYNEIQNLPSDIKSLVTKNYPSVDNVSLAKSILTGDKGFAKLQQDLTTFEIQAASQRQGLGVYDAVTGQYGGIKETTARDLVGRGYNFNTANQALGQVAIEAPRYQMLTEFSDKAPVKSTAAQEEVIDALMAKNAAQQRKLSKQIELEGGRFSGKSGVGTLASSRRAQSF